MDILRALFISIAVLAAFCGASNPAAASESYDNCVGFIDALPAVITTQGTWCLRQNLDTSATSGNMIEIQTNNVTIDCNGFRLRGSGGSASTTAEGIHATGQLNLVIRHCTIRGFQVGIELSGFDPAERIGHQAVLAARKRGAIIRPLGDVVVLMPPLSISQPDLRRLVSITAAAIAEASLGRLRAAA